MLPGWLEKVKLFFICDQSKIVKLKTQWAFFPKVNHVNVCVTSQELTNVTYSSPAVGKDYEEAICRPIYLLIYAQSTRFND